MLNSGDRVLFQGGQTFFGNLTFSSNEVGSSAFPIVITSYGSGRATLNAGAGRGIMAYNTHGYRISNLALVGSGSTNTGEGINFYTDLAGDAKLDYIAIDNTDVSGFGTYGISIGGYNGASGFSNVSITYNRVHDNRNSGIVTFGFFSSTAVGYANANVYVGHCTVFNHTGISGSTANTGSGIVLGGVDGGVIERSVAYNNGALNTHNGGPVGIWTWDSNNVLIRFNESYSNHTASQTDGGGFDLDGGVTNSVLEYNYSHDNDGPGLLAAQFSGARPFSNNVIRYNISQNDARQNGPGSIHFWNGGSGIQNVDVYGNTVYISPAPSGSPRALTLATPVTNIHIRNNILMTAGGLTVADIADGQSGLLMQGNNYWSSGAPLMLNWAGQSYSTLADWRNATGQERLNGSPVGLNIDPLLTAPGAGPALNNSDQLSTLAVYKLMPGSPMIDAGLNLPLLFGVVTGPTDYYGNPDPSGANYDIGAHEFSLAVVQNQPPVVSAGSNQSITLPTTATMHGSVSDDGYPNPPGVTSVTWDQMSGPGPAQFQNANSLTTAVGFPVAGSYVLRLTAFDGQYTSTSTLTVSVAAAVIATPDFRLTLSQSTISLSTRQTGTLSVTVTAQNGFSDVVHLTNSGQPKHSNLTFSATSISGSGASTLMFSLGPPTAPGSYPVTITGTSGSIVHSASVVLTVLP